MPSALLDDPLQFVFTSTVHSLFLQLTMRLALMGLALLLLYLR